jgi:hypothetical protein
MPDRPSKEKRKEMLDLWKSRQREEARKKLPLPNSQMKAMFDMLDTELPIHDCDRSLSITKRWLEANGLPVEQVLAWLHDNGGHCDCEALANSEERWKDAIHDVP